MKRTRREHKNESSVLLVIEPDAATRSGMKRLFEMNGYAVTAVSDDAEAVAVARRRNYDLILFDSNLPPPKSFAGAHKIRQREELKNMPLVVISVHENFGALPDNADIDKFSIACFVDLTRFGELENFVACLMQAKI